MWADNETSVDLLGFDFVVDSLFVALTEPRLLPLTIGLLGDWGSGKSSLLKIVRAELDALATGESPEQYVCVEFSPWQYEDYDDIKVALMSAVLDRLEQEITSAAEHQRVSWLRQRVRWFRGRGRALGRFALTAAPAVVAAGSGLVDPSLLSPDVVQMATSVVAGAAAAGAQSLEDPSTPEAEVGASPTVEVADFREQFTLLLENLEQVKAVVVLIDDLDRCLPESVVDTFEAIRLFLNSPKTAFVVATNQLVVESAIDSRYPELRRPDGRGIGADYLEKMLQLKVAIPALSAPEAETYINLLLAELWLTTAQFEAVLTTVRRERAANPLAVGFNLGIAEAQLGAHGLPQPLVDDLEWATHIAPAITRGLRGNPRQLKRFLNNVMLRSRSARRRSIELKPAVVAKLLVLEEQHFGDFKKLFDWQIATAGPVEQLRLAEDFVRHPRQESPDDAPNAGHGAEADETAAAGRSELDHADRQSDPEPPAHSQLPPEVGDWLEREHIRDWLNLEPELAGLDLRPYFTYARDRLSLGVAAVRLAPELQQMLGNLQSDVAAIRRTAITAAVGLDPEQRAQLIDALIDIVARNPAGQSLTAAVEVAGRAPDALQAVRDGLMRLPLNAVPAQRVPTVVRHLPLDQPIVVALLDKWQNSGVPALERATVIARRQAAQSGR